MHNYHTPIFTFFIYNFNEHYAFIVKKLCYLPVFIVAFFKWKDLFYIYYVYILNFKSFPLQNIGSPKIFTSITSKFTVNMVYA